MIANTDTELEELVARLKRMARLVGREFIPDPEKIRAFKVAAENRKKRVAEPPHAD